MIYHLRNRFIKICMLSFMTVFVIFLIAIYLFNTVQINRQFDGLVDVISENNGHLPEPDPERLTLTCICVFIAVTLIVLFLVIILSRYAVRPIAESYEKQKRFITDASHELKTPLTLILTNVEIMQGENGPNEWLDDIKCEGEQMNFLIRQMISLARMDEAGAVLEQQAFNLSAALQEVTASFASAIHEKNLRLIDEIPDSLICTANEPAIRQLFSILLDNAVKYCDPQGIIHITLKKTSGFGYRPHTVLTVDNTYAAVSSLNLEHLFDRFYRSDQARTTGEGFGIGLSVAQSIAKKHHTRITAQAIDNTTIRFRIKL